MLQDLRYSWRQMRKTPIFTLTAVLSLSLGIGASVTMFSAFRAVFLRAPAYRDASRIVEIKKTADHGYTPSNTMADLEFLRRHAQSFESSAGYGFFETATLSGISEPAGLWVRSVSKELFPLLDARPFLGRTFIPADFQPNAPLSVVLSFATWQRYFHGDRRIVGTSIFLNRQSCAVVGVMPREFYFPQAGIAAWMPDRTAITDPAAAYTAIVARLRPRISVAEARLELERLKPLLNTYPASERNFGLTVEQVATRDVEEYRTAFLFLLGATGFLVLLACLNVASLQLARASSRRNEFLVRGALGANRARLIGQVLTESALLASFAVSFGLGLTYAGNRILLWLLPTYLEVPRLQETHLDLLVLAYAVLLTTCAAVLFGLAPAVGLSSTKFGDSDRQARSTSAKSLPNSLLLIAEVAIALVLFAGSVLMIRGFVRLTNVNPGVRTARVLTIGIPPSHAAALSRAQLTQRYSAMLQAAQSSPGVQRAALTSYLPFGSIVVELQLFVPGKSAHTYQIEFHAVSADYFEIMGIPLLRGRVFGRMDAPSGKGVIVVNRALADRFWPGQNAIGQHLSSRPPPAAPDLTVIGVVADTRHRTLSGGAVPEFYEYYQQYLGPAVGTTLVLQTTAESRR